MKGRGRAATASSVTSDGSGKKTVGGTDSPAACAALICRCLLSAISAGVPVAPAIRAGSSSAAFTSHSPVSSSGMTTSGASGPRITRSSAATAAAASSSGAGMTCSACNGRCARDGRADRAKADTRYPAACSEKNTSGAGSASPNPIRTWWAIPQRSLLTDRFKMRTPSRHGLKRPTMTSSSISRVISRVGDVRGIGSSPSRHGPGSEQ